MYADGDTGVVPRSNMFPMVGKRYITRDVVHQLCCPYFFFYSLTVQDYLELDVPVMIMANKQSSQPKSNG